MSKILLYMDLNTIIGKINNVFLDSIAIFLTGSQVNMSDFVKTSDIDILVLDKAVSDVHSYGINVEGYKIDCTIVPLFDIENVLLNEQQHEKRTILNMIVSGKIISGTSEIGLEIKKIAHIVSLKENKNALLVAKESTGILKKINNYFEKGISDIEKVLLLSELIHHSSKIEAIRLKGNEANHLHKIKVIQDNNPSFLIQLSKLFWKVLQENDVTMLDAFIKGHLQNLENQTDASNKGILAIELKTSLSVEEFYTRIITEIQNNDLLQSHFLFLYRSLKKYHWAYKYDVTLVFSLTESDVFEMEIIAAVKKVFLVIEDAGFVFRKHIDVNYNFLELDKHFFKLYQLAVKEKIICNIAFFACCRFAQALQLSVSDIVNVNKILLQKWILHKTEQKEIKNRNILIKIQKSRLKKFDFEYEQKKHLFELEGCKPFEEQIDTLINFINNLSDYSFLSSEFIPDIVFQVMGITNIRHCKVYMSITQELFKMLSLPEDEKAKFIYFSSLSAIQMA